MLPEISTFHCIAFHGGQVGGKVQGRAPVSSTSWRGKQSAKFKVELYLPIVSYIVVGGASMRAVAVRGFVLSLASGFSLRLSATSFSLRESKIFWVGRHIR